MYIYLRLPELTLSGAGGVLEGIPGTTQAAELSHAGVCTEPRGRRLVPAALAPSHRAHGRARAVDQVLAGRAAQLALDQVDLVDPTLGEGKQRLSLLLHAGKRGGELRILRFHAARRAEVLRRLVRVGVGD